MLSTNGNEIEVGKVFSDKNCTIVEYKQKGESTHIDKSFNHIHILENVSR